MGYDPYPAKSRPARIARRFATTRASRFSSVAFARSHAIENRLWDGHNLRVPTCLTKETKIHGDHPNQDDGSHRYPEAHFGERRRRARTLQETGRGDPRQHG